MFIGMELWGWDCGGSGLAEWRIVSVERVWVSAPVLLGRPARVRGVRG